MPNFKVGDRVVVKDKEFTRLYPSLNGDLTIKGFICDGEYAEFNETSCVSAVGRLEHVPPAVTIDPARTYRTRDGREVLRILCTDAPGAYPVVALVRGKCEPEAWFACKRTADGRECDGQRLDGQPFLSGGDLIEVKPERAGWVNIYPGCVSSALSFSKQYATKELADSNAMNDRIACVYLKFREGDGLKGGK